MINLVDQLFDQWLTLMEKAFNNLSPKDFRELEQKIIREIRSSRAQRSMHCSTSKMTPSSEKLKQLKRFTGEIDG
jgi:ATP-dependent helicase/DNAse subunit B